MQSRNYEVLIKTMKKSTFILTILLNLCNICFALDPHFSQFYASPLTLNPALTGISFGEIRFSTNYRNQWSTITPFRTYSASVDMSILENSNFSFGGIGFLARNDISENGIKNLKFQFSASYHKPLDVKGNHYISLGIQVGMEQKNLNNSSLSSQNQWVPSQGFDPAISNGENFSIENIIYPDLQAGLFWHSFIGKRSMFFSGISIFHLSEPEVSFFGSDFKLKRRYVLHGGSRITIRNNININPNIIIMQQNSVREINIGCAFGYDLTTGSDYKMFTMGIWYRNKDAIIITSNFEYKSLTVGISYDVNVSGLSEITQNKGGFELTINYKINKTNLKKTQLPSTPCPRL